MHRLVILPITDPKAKMQPTLLKGNFDFEESGHAELRALRYLMYCPKDIVMLVELKESFCKHCGKAIVEKEGAILHTWVHEQTGAYLCWSNDHTKAEPKEDV